MKTNITFKGKAITNGQIVTGNSLVTIEEGTFIANQVTWVDLTDDYQWVVKAVEWTAIEPSTLEVITTLQTILPNGLSATVEKTYKIRG